MFIFYISKLKILFEYVPLQRRYNSFPTKPLTIVDKRKSVLPKGATENDYVTYGVYVCTYNVLRLIHLLVSNNRPAVLTVLVFYFLFMWFIMFFVLLLDQFWERVTAPCLTQPKYIAQREKSVKVTFKKSNRRCINQS